MFGYSDPGSVIVQSEYEDRPRDFPIQVFAHELGHSIGLDQDVHDGIDAADVPFAEYPSIMNYAALNEEGHLEFSDGSHSEADVDDWRFLETNLYTPSTSSLGPGDADC